MTSIFVAAAVWRQFEAETTMSLIRLCADRRVSFSYLKGDALVTRARNILATRFMDWPAQDLLLSIDSDVEFQADQVLRMCEQAHARQAIVGALSVTRTQNGRAVPTCWLRSGTKVRMGDPELVAIDYAGGGCMAVPRTVFETLARQGVKRIDAGNGMSAYEFYDCFRVLDDEVGELPLSEDWALCHRARAAGFEILLDPAVEIRHHGGYAFTWHDLTPGEPRKVVWVERLGSDLNVGWRGPVAVEPEPELVAV